QAWGYVCRNGVWYCVMSFGGPVGMSCCGCGFCGWWSLWYEEIVFLAWFSRREEQVVSDQPVARPRLALAPASYEAVEPEIALAETAWRDTERPVAPVIREPKRSEKPLTSQWPVAPLARPQRPEIVVKKFVLWLLEQGYRGEY